MPADAQTVLDYATGETDAEKGLMLLERMERRLARAGYLPVLHVNPEKRPTFPAGFFLIEYRRLDDPRHRVLLSTDTDSYKGDDCFRVTFDKVSLSYPVSVRGLVDKFRYRAEATAPVTISARDVVENYTKGISLPLGEPDHDRYRALAYTLQNRTTVRFHIDATAISHAHMIISARVEPDVYPTGRVLSPVDRILKGRRVFLSVPTALADEKKLALHIRAENAVSVNGRQPTTAQSVSLWQFTHFHDDIIRRHVQGKTHPSYQAAPQFGAF